MVPHQAPRTVEPSSPKIKFWISGNVPTREKTQVRFRESLGYLQLSSDRLNSGKRGNTCRVRKRDRHIGYSTDFNGRFDLDKPLTPAHKAYLVAFATTRRMARNATLAANLPDAIRIAAGLWIGPDGAYFVGNADDGNFGQNVDKSVIDSNSSGRSMPGLWCQWVPTQDGCGIEWDGNEKFYEYQEWLSYIITHFLAPWGYTLNGTIVWEGEDSSDKGKLIVKDNAVSTKRGRTVYR
jgi:hypothetical protein